MKQSLFHIWLFLFGFIYYLIIPLVVVASRVWENYPGMDNLYAYYKDDYWFGYSLIIILIGLSFLIGALLPLHYFNESRPFIHKQIVVNSRGMLLISFPLFLYSQYLILANRGSLFQGYAEGLDIAFVGSLATISMFFLFLFIYNKVGDYSRVVNWFLCFILIELTIVVLGLGTRMYAMVTVFSILIYLIDKNVVTIKKMLVWLSAIVLLILMIGIWRMGDTNFTLEQLVYIGIAEPSFTWISAISMYDLNNLPLFAFPFNFITSFINFLPSVLLPEKGEMISEVVLNHDAPLGAMSILLSLIDNFGIVGSFIACFCLGFFLTQVRLRWQTVFGKTYYYCICGIIPFQLFRDPVDVVNKGFFSNFLILPLLIIFVHRIMSLLATRPE